jgi:photosystem II stability/assembly factor-like uncharacterized protein
MKKRTRAGVGSRSGKKQAAGARKTAEPKAAAAIAHPDVDVPPKAELIPGQIRPARKLAAGPRKLRQDGPPSPRLSNHKSRSVWFQARAAWPLREAPVRNLVNERERAIKAVAPLAGTALWESAGPSNIGGRLTALAVHPQNPDRIWAGAAGGGVWFSPNAGQSWQPQWHDQDVLNVGSLALDPAAPDVLYCGTGEANLSADSYAGVGIYQTRDAGSSWFLLASAEAAKIPRRIGVIAVDPFNSLHLRIGGVGYGEVAQEADFGGMYVSRDGGASWTRETFVSELNYWCHSIVFHPAKAGFLYATVTAQGVKSGIYRSVDGGQSWQQLKNGLPAPERFGRARLAISLSNPDVLYALAADAASQRSDLVLGVFRSADGGSSWQDVKGTHFKSEAQINYGNSIAIHPQDPDFVLCGGVDLHLSRNGGKTWKQVTKWDAQRGTPGYAHADHHFLAIPAAMPNRIYSANDGGLDVSENGGTAWINRSNGLAVNMYYDMDVAQSDGATFGGGAQDTGSLITTSGKPNDHREILGGDGGWMVFDPQDAGHLYASYYNFNIFRFRAGNFKDVSPAAAPDEKNFIWMCYIAMDPNAPRTLFTGTYRVWRTKNDGDTWSPVSAALDGSAISAIEIARADSNRVYAGTENGKLFRSLDGGDTWSANLGGPTIPGHAITRLACDPGDPNTVYATVANFGHSHLFRSGDSGETWEDIDKGRLPDVPHHCVLMPADGTGRLFVCNDAGVFVSEDAGATWLSLSRNLPNVMVVDLAYHLHDRTLTAATYGRSLWRLSV